MLPANWKVRTPLPTLPTCNRQTHEGQRQKPPYLPCKLGAEKPQRSGISDTLVIPTTRSTPFQPTIRSVTVLKELDPT